MLPTSRTNRRQRNAKIISSKTGTKPLPVRFSPNPLNMPLSLQDLALCGATPRFRAPLHVGRPNVVNSERVLERIGQSLESKCLTNHGPLTRELEERICTYLGVRNAIVTSNATAGLEVVAGCLEISGEVIMPAWTFVASAHAFHRMGATPVFCDIDPRTHCLDPRAVEALIGLETQAILGVHLWGRPCIPEELETIAKRYGLKLLFDSAHALGCSRGDRMIGGYGDVEVFSLHATKAINAFEGGIVTTNDDTLAQHIRQAANFGFSGYDSVVALGTNAKMSEASAAMGLTSLENRESIFKANRTNLERYVHRLGALAGITVLQPSSTDESNYHYVVAEIDPEQTELSRDTLVDALYAENVIARKYFYPGVHRMAPYAGDARFTRQPLPHTENRCQRTLALPNGLSVSETEIDAICDIIECCLSNAAELEKARYERSPSHLPAS